MWRSLFTGKERREYVRLNIELKVDFKLEGEDEKIPWHQGKTRDISPGGMCLATDVFSKKEWEEIARKKKHLRLYIYFPGYKEGHIKAEAEVQRIDMEAQVVWQMRESRGGKDECLLGLHFTKVEKDSQELIRGYIIEKLIKEYHPA
jgi:c-di-GMP-binding flagellar brake protein YcgR